MRVLFLLTLVGAVGCYSVDRPAAGDYNCSLGTPATSECPPGYECDGKKCVKQGTVTDGAPLDQPVTEGPPADGPPTEGPVPDQGPPVSTVSTFAGSGTAGALNTTVLAATFDNPMGIASDNQGRVYVADFNNHCIRMITGNNVSTFAGKCGNAGTANGGKLVGRLRNPVGVAVDLTGQKVFVADWGNNCIRLVTGGSMSTIAGKCGVVPGFQDGASGQAKFWWPSAVMVTASSGLLVADSENHCIRVVNLGQVSTFAGVCKTKGFLDDTVTKALFHTPVGLALGPKGEIYVSEWGGGDLKGGQRIRRIAGGQVTTFAGSGQKGFADGPANTAAFNNPMGMTVGATGQVLVADSGNHRIRVIFNGQVGVLAGAGAAGHKDGDAPAAMFNTPKGLAFLSPGKLLVADTINNRIRLVSIP